MTPTEAIDAYCHAFAARDTRRAVALFAEGALYEMPLLRGRMVGKAEIQAGLVRAFEIMTACTIDMGPVMATGASAIGEGVMTAATTRGLARIPFALVAVVEGGLLRRLSVHLDARPYRPWSDGPVLAVAP